MLHKVVGIIVGLSLVSSIPVEAFARESSARDSRERKVATASHRDEIVVSDHTRYRYHDGKFYRPALFGLFGLFFTVRPQFGIAVSTLPMGRHTLVAGGVRYYSYNDIYYRDCPSGYMVVPAPAINAYTATGESIVVNVPNANGSYTPVRLVKSNNGYIGPQGEFYPDHPSVDQLRVLYGT